MGRPHALTCIGLCVMSSALPLLWCYSAPQIRHHGSKTSCSGFLPRRSSASERWLAEEMVGLVSSCLLL